MAHKQPDAIRQDITDVASSHRKRVDDRSPNNPLKWAEKVADEAFHKYEHILAGETKGERHETE